METYKKDAQPVTDEGHVSVNLGLKDTSIQNVDVGAMRRIYFLHQWVP